MKHCRFKCWADVVSARYVWPSTVRAHFADGKTFEVDVSIWMPTPMKKYRTVRPSKLGGSIEFVGNSREVTDIDTISFRAFNGCPKALECLTSDMAVEDWT